MDESRHNIGDLLAFEAPDGVWNRLICGVISKKEYDKRWNLWHYAVVWSDDNASNRKSNSLRYLDGDINYYKHSLQEWLRLGNEI